MEIMDLETPIASLKVVALAGGVGGAKLADGLAGCLPAENLCVIVNIGDDFEHLGLAICPDLDTVCYTLAGLANPETGWGRIDESWNCMESLTQLGGPAWFSLGDRDLGTHLERTRRLQIGDPLSEITQDFCRKWGIQVTVLPASDDRVSTWVYTDEGELPFQEYFVHRQCRPRISGFRFDEVEHARPSPGVLDAIDEADLVIICPSNPWVSVDPILSIPGIKPAIKRKTVLAVSPIIAGKTVKGPAAKMFRELGIQPSAASVANHYGKVLSGFVIDVLDTQLSSDIQAAGVLTLLAETIMKTTAERRSLAKEVLEFGIRIKTSE